MEGVGFLDMPKIEDVYSFYTRNLILVAARAKSPEKYYSVLSPKEIIDSIMLDAEKEWLVKMEKFDKKDNMRKACMRNIFKHSREAYKTRTYKNLSNLGKLDFDKNYVETWFDAVHDGYNDFMMHLSDIMEEITSMPWVNKDLIIKEGASLRTFSVIVPVDEFDNSLYNNVCGYEDVFCDNHGNMMSLENYLRSEIDRHRLIIKGEKGIRTFDEDEILLNRSYMHKLPCMSMPLKKGDRGLVRNLAESFDRAQKELDYLTYSDDDECKNEYYSLYPKLNDYLELKIKEQQKIIMYNNKRNEHLDTSNNMTQYYQYKKSIQEYEGVLESKLDDFKEDKLPNEEIYLVKDS